MKLGGVEALLKLLRGGLDADSVRAIMKALAELLKEGTAQEVRRLVAWTQQPCASWQGSCCVPKYVPFRGGPVSRPDWTSVALWFHTRVLTP